MAPDVCRTALQGVTPSGAVLDSPGRSVVHLWASFMRRKEGAPGWPSHRGGGRRSPARRRDRPRSPARSSAALRSWRGPWHDTAACDQSGSRWLCQSLVGFRVLRPAGDRRQKALVPISPAKTVLASRWACRVAWRLGVSHIQRSQGSAVRYGSAGRRAAGPARSAWRYRGATPPRLPPGPRHSKGSPG